MMNNWGVYILECKDGSLYTGVTPDINRRFQEHKEGRGGRYTRLSKVDEIVYCENYLTRKEALKRERQIKGWRREKKENLIKYRNPKEPV